ncbi:MAG: pilus assembly protein FimV, partial [Enterobacterales bacterium]
MARKFIFMLIISFASAASSVMALGLGEIVLKSGLNQPLNAEITLLSIRGESNDQLKGKLG